MPSLVTVEEFAAYPKVVAAGVSTDGALQVLDAVSDDVRDYCGWHIAPSVTETLTVDGSGGEVLGLPTLHLTAVASIAEDGEDLDVDGVEWSQAGYLRKPYSRWTAKLRGVTAEVTHGYDTTPPGLLALVCDMALARLTVPVGVSREQSGGESVTYAAPGEADFTTRQRRLLDRRYRIADRP